MKVTFLGTAGGRFAVITQKRASGGFILEMDGEMLHIDPGPGALVRAKQYGIDLRKLTGVLCSHRHPDHYTDLEYVIESITSGKTKKRGVLVAAENVVKSDGDWPVVSKYHQNALERVEILKPGKKTEIGSIEIIGTETHHGEPDCIGFVFRGNEGTLGYTSDGEYFPGMEKYFKDVDYLIVNVLRPRTESWPEHMNSKQAVKFLEKVKPKLAVLNAFGMLMIKAGPEKEGKWIEKRSGVETLAAKDGMVVDLLKGKTETIKPRMP